MGLFGKPKATIRGLTKKEEVKSITTFEEELTSLINKYSLEALSNTPDFILAYYLKDALLAFQNAQQRRTEWWTLRHEKLLAEKEKIERGEEAHRPSQIMPLQDH